MTTEASRSVDEERVLVGRYRIVRPIARGAMAEVWEAHDETLGRAVAVKVLHSHLAQDESFLERFRREAIAAARLAHPNVVATYDTGTDGDVAFIVMELVHGRTLRQVLSDEGPMSPRRVIDIGAQVADALNYAHRAGVIHRDVKPANILLCDDGRAKVADFGIAKAAIEAIEDATGAGPVPGGKSPTSTSDLTQSGAIVGTAKYLSPEQVNGEPVDGRSDVYALGVVLYEMVCGRAPYAGETDVAVALQHLSGTPLPPRQVRAGIPRSLESVVLRAMAKSPANRYATAGQLQTALLSVDLRADDAAPTSNREITPPGGVPKFRDSERSWLVPVVLIVILAITLSVVGVLFARSETGQNLLDLPDGGSSKAQPAQVTNVSAFDPEGDGGEHDNELANLIDGDTATTWSTERYNNGQFGAIKTGVGFVLDLDQSQKLDELQVSSPNRGWAASVYVADSPKDSLDTWGAPVATKDGIDGEATFDLKSHNGAAVLVWVTALGDNSSFSASDVRLTT
ncbi:MAG TPA: protein kinase [Acidimicrobiales bacterium]|nr:protein kinase [Acidimicrobiales bacterium]